MTVGNLDGPVCECGTVFTLPAHLGRHQPMCLGAAPTLKDLHRVGKVTRARGCVEWNGKRNDQGYGILAPIAAAQVGEWRAHRAAYKLGVGPIPNGLNVLHSCDNPPCINVKHLRPGTQADNAADMTERDRYGGRFQRVPLEERVCPICGAIHARRPGDRQITCSLTCAAKLSWQTAPDRSFPSSGGEDRTCSECSAPFHVDRPSIRTTTCSPACAGQRRWRVRREQ